MFSVIKSLNLQGIEGFCVDVEIDITRGMPCFNIVGLASVEVKEAKERVKSAIINSNFEFPNKRIIVNLSPADVKKEGSLLDLPISIGLLRNYLNRREDYLKESIFVGELSLDGTLKKIRGALPIAWSAKEMGYKRIFIPKDNKRECSYVTGIDVIPVDNLKQCIDFINNKIDLVLNKTKFDIKNLPQNKFFDEDFSDVKGNYFVKRGLEIAAAGNHNLLMIGPPGSGKTMMARRIRTIMPSLDEEEFIEINKIYSIAGLINNNLGIINERPFREPHHSATTASIIGGGAKSTPGEIVLANRGCLLLDEFTEFSRKTLDTFREPMESGYVNLSRLKNFVSYPCNCLILATMNPCACGHYLSDTQCKCTSYDRSRYISKISGPILDRFDIFMQVNSIKYSEFNDRGLGETSSQIRERVENAKNIQRERFKYETIKNNNEIRACDIDRYCVLDKEGRDISNKIFTKYKLSNRSYTKLLKTARTIADLQNLENITKDNILEAFSYRKGYYKYFG